MKNLDLEKNENSSKGITLVALVISIIVLLILATVSISLIINSGIINKAEYAVFKYSEEEELEQIKIAVINAKLDGNGFLTAENLNNELKLLFNNDNTVIESSDYFFYKPDKNYRIYKDGKIEEGNLLPDEYQQVEYIKSTGKQYIDTGLLAKDYINLNFYITGKYSTTTKNQYIFGCSDGTAGTSTYHLYGIAYGSSDFVGQKGVGGSEQIIKQADTNMHEFTLNLLNNSASLDSNLNVQLENSGNQYINQNYFLFAINHGGIFNYAASFSMYTCKIMDNNKYIRNYIPCYSTTIVTNTDGVQVPANTNGLYDLVDGKFYTNKGTGKFIAGPDV